MNKLKLGLITVVAIIAVSCQEEATPSTQTSLNENVQRPAKKVEPIEVTNFRNRIKEMSGLNRTLTDSEQGEFMYQVAKDLLNKHGNPQDMSDEIGFTDEKGKTSILGFRRFIELIKNK